jgi:hypothetical protein
MSRGRHCTIVRSANRAAQEMTGVSSVKGALRLPSQP